MEKRFIWILIILVLVTVSCGNHKTTNSKTQDQLSTTNSKTQDQLSLNISIFLDLSDRLTSDMTPSQMYRDTAIVNYIVDYFKTTTDPDIVKSKNKLNVFCDPTPKDPEIATLMQGLKVDLGQKKILEKRIALNSMKPQFQKNISQIYQKILDENEWPGSDIWSFFQNKKVDDLCVQSNSRNIIIILTDGYIYHASTKIKEGHAYSYILSQTLSDKQSSLIDRRTGELKGKGIEVLLLEVNPQPKSHHDQMLSILEGWFKSMGVEKVKVSGTEADMGITKTIIKKILDDK